MSLRFTSSLISDSCLRTTIRMGALPGRKPGRLASFWKLFRSLLAKVASTAGASNSTRTSFCTGQILDCDVHKGIYSARRICRKPGVVFHDSTGRRA